MEFYIYPKHAGLSSSRGSRNEGEGNWKEEGHDNRVSLSPDICSQLLKEAPGKPREALEAFHFTFVLQKRNSRSMKNKGQ